MPHQERLRLVVDTNIWVSYLLTGSFSKLADAMGSKRFVLLYSEESLAELEGLKLRRKIAKVVPELLFDAFIRTFKNAGESVLLIDIEPVSRDAKDDHILALAKHGKADILVTGDEDLLVLKDHAGARILRPAEFFKEFSGSS
jgi:putative PIN family toxin of toxin-antitoxin system